MVDEEDDCQAACTCEELAAVILCKHASSGKAGTKDEVRYGIGEDDVLKVRLHLHSEQQRQVGCWVTVVTGIVAYARSENSNIHTHCHFGSGSRL